jgi:hypothetical protein
MGPGAGAGADIAAEGSSGNGGCGGAGTGPSSSVPRKRVKLQGQVRRSRGGTCSCMYARRCMHISSLHAGRCAHGSGLRGHVCAVKCSGEWRGMCAAAARGRAGGRVDARACSTLRSCAPRRVGSTAAHISAAVALRARVVARVGTCGTETYDERRGGGGDATESAPGGTPAAWCRRVAAPARAVRRSARGRRTRATANSATRRPRGAEMSTRARKATASEVNGQRRDQTRQCLLTATSCLHCARCHAQAAKLAARGAHQRNHGAAKVATPRARDCGNFRSVSAERGSCCARMAAAARAARGRPAQRARRSTLRARLACVARSRLRKRNRRQKAESESAQKAHARRRRRAQQRCVHARAHGAAASPHAARARSADARTAFVRRWHTAPRQACSVSLRSRCGPAPSHRRCFAPPRKASVSVSVAAVRPVAALAADAGASSSMPCQQPLVLRPQCCVAAPLSPRLRGWPARTAGRAGVVARKSQHSGLRGRALR